MQLVWNHPSVQKLQDHLSKMKLSLGAQIGIQLEAIVKISL